MKADHSIQKENTHVQDYTQDASNASIHKISKRVILSFLQIAKRILELYFTQQLISENELAFDSVLWLILILIQFSYNLIMVAAIICNYNTYFLAINKFTKNFIIILCLADLDSIYQVICYQKQQQQQQCRLFILTQQKMNFISRISVLYMCTFVYLFGFNQRIIYLSDIILLVIYFFILYFQFQTLGEQIRILQIFYIGAMIEVDFFFKKNNLASCLIFIEFVVVLILILVCTLIILKQRNYLHAFASRYMIKESSRIIFFKPAVIVKDFAYIQSPSLPELVNLYVFKVKFKHLGYAWRIVENAFVSTYLIFQTDQLKNKQQAIIIPSLMSLGYFHQMFNLIICALSYFYALNLLFRTIKIVKFIPSLSNQIIQELQDLKTNQIRSEKCQSYYWTPSSDLDTNIMDLRKQTSKCEKISKKIPKIPDLHQQCKIQLDHEIKHAQFVQQQKNIQLPKNIIQNSTNKQITDDNQLSWSYALIKSKEKHISKFFSLNSSFIQQAEAIQDQSQQNNNNNNKTQTKLVDQINEQNYKTKNIYAQCNPKGKYFTSIKKQNTFLKQHKNKINNTQIKPQPRIETQNILQEEQHKKFEQSNNFIDISQIKLQNQQSTSKIQQTYELNRQSPQNIFSFKNESSNTHNHTKNNIILLTNCDDDSVQEIVSKN
ncbi:hypothetical protein ABPG74_008106 [Tetrahymena malaccensis]